MILKHSAHCYETVDRLHILSSLNDIIDMYNRITFHIGLHNSGTVKFCRNLQFILSKLYKQHCETGLLILIVTEIVNFQFIKS